MRKVFETARRDTRFLCPFWVQHNFCEQIVAAAPLPEPYNILYRIPQCHSKLSEVGTRYPI